MGEEELQAFKKELELMKRKIEEDLGAKSVAINKANQARDEADYALLEKGQNITNVLMHRQVENLKAIDRSLARFDEGSYGTCDSCGEEINIERLKVKPFADYCIDCREIIEKEIANK